MAVGNAREKKILNFVLIRMAFCDRSNGGDVSNFHHAPYNCVVR